MLKDLTVGEVAQRSGVAAGNQRRYARDVLRRIAIIRVAQDVGIPLAEIAEALSALPDGRTPSRKDWREMSAGWAKQLDQRIAQLKKLRDGLADCIGCGCMSIDKCPLRNPQDRLAGKGPGPRRLQL